MTVVDDRPTAAPAPGPQGRRLYGTLARFRRDPLGVLADLPRSFGGVVRLQVGPYRLHEVTDPDAVRQVLQGNARNFVRGRLYRTFRPFFGRGMLTTDGDEWRRGRRIGQPFFHRARLRDASPAITHRTLAMLDRWEEHARSGRPVDLNQDMMRLAMEVLGRMILGTELDGHVDRLLPAVSFAAKAVVVNGEPGQLLPGWVPTRYGRRLRRARRTMNQVMDTVIREQAARPDASPGDNFVAALLADGALSHQQIRDQLLTVFLAGHETTGCALSWTLYAVAQHPDVRHRLEDELDALPGGRPPAADDLPQLPYLRQVVDESLRLYPPIWAIPRDVVADEVLAGCRVPGGSSLLIPLHTIHNDPGRWDNPGAFDPERFCPARGTSGTSVDRTDSERTAAERSAAAGSARASAERAASYLPFGAGTRKCIGYEMALLELQLAVGAIVQRFRMELLPAQWIRPLPVVSLRPRPRIMVRVAARERS